MISGKASAPKISLKFSADEKNKSHILEGVQYLQVKKPSMSKLPDYNKDKVGRNLPEKAIIEETDRHTEYMDRVNFIKDKYA